jgi:hypothetical protein
LFPDVKPQGQAQTFANSYYTFTLTGLSLVPGSSVFNPATGNITANYTGGTLRIFFDDADDMLPANGLPSTGGSFAAGAGSGPGTNANTDGVLYLEAANNVSVASTFNVATLGGGFVGDFFVTGGTALAFIGNFRQGLINGTLDARSGVVPAGYQFQVSGVAELIPEPSTFALLGAGLLPMAGAIARRRRS